MKSIIKWIASILEESKGVGSSKRVAMFWCMAILNYMVVKQTSNMEMFWGIAGMILIFAGYNVSEKLINNSKLKTVDETQESNVVQPDPNDPKPR